MHALYWDGNPITKRGIYTDLLEAALLLGMAYRSTSLRGRIILCPNVQAVAEQ
jgi:hypothetical protein